LSRNDLTIAAVIAAIFSSLKFVYSIYFVYSVFLIRVDD